MVKVIGHSWRGALKWTLLERFSRRLKCHPLFFTWTFLALKAQLFSQPQVKPLVTLTKTGVKLMFFKIKNASPTAKLMLLLFHDLFNPIFYWWDSPYFFITAKTEKLPSKEFLCTLIKIHKKVALTVPNKFFKRKFVECPCRVSETDNLV